MLFQFAAFRKKKTKQKQSIDSTADQEGHLEPELSNIEVIDVQLQERKALSRFMVCLAVIYCT